MTRSASGGRPSPLDTLPHVGILWTEARNDDLVRINVRSVTSVVVSIETRLMIDNTEPEGSLVPVNAPPWMSSMLHPADGTAELLQRGGRGKQRREPRGWQVNVEEPVWGVLMDPGCQHFYVESRSLCERIQGYIGPCFTAPVQNILQCPECASFATALEDGRASA